jgi:hypothetical protein
MRPLKSYTPNKLLGATIFAAALLVACYEPVSPPHRAPALILPDTGTADGASLLALAVKLDTGATPADKRAITLTTTAGTFTTGGTNTATLTPDASGAAIALLRAPGDSTTAIISATVNGETVSRTVIFHRALPERIDVVPDQLTLRPGTGAELAVTVQLRRAVGTPSPGTRVELSSFNVSSGTISTALFLPATLTSDATGAMRARFTAPDRTYFGPVQLRATAVQSGVSGDAIIQLIP